MVLLLIGMNIALQRIQSLLFVTFPCQKKTSITDIRSWFGMVNQLALFLATTAMMAPFRDLLKSSNLKGRHVYWDDELKKTFEDTKLALCQVAGRGLSYFDIHIKTQ